MMMMIGAVIVTAIVNPLFLVPVFFLSFIFHIVRKNYLLTSRRIKRLEGAARSPVFSLLADLLQDLPTVRALNAEEMLKLRVEGYQDTHSSAWFMLISASTAFGFALDLMCLVFISVVTCAFLAYTPEDEGAESNVGLAITQAMMLTGKCDRIYPIIIIIQQKLFQL
jgi:ABC-type multidrug transport system fused ATPase/permease subunit